MYVPHLDAVLKNLGMTRPEFDMASSVSVPTSLLKFLLQVTVASGDFNKSGYLSANKDIADAVDAGKVSDPQLHYIKFGYFEGRTGGFPEVNEAWYLKTYKDVGDAVRLGKLTSAREHFVVQGAAEGRAPNEQSSADAAQWKRAFGRT